MGIPCSGRS